MPSWFSIKKQTDNCVIYYNLKFDDETSFPKVFEAIQVDRDIRVQLEFNGNPLPLPTWFIQGTDAKLKIFSIFENFPSYIENVSAENPYSLLDEIKNRDITNQEDVLPYSSAMTRYAFDSSI